MATETKTVKAPKPRTARPAKVAKIAAVEEKSDGLLAAILIRGREMGVRHDIRQTLENLKLQRRHICVVYPDCKSTRGMLNKAKDLITYGPITPATLAKLEEKRGSLKDRDGKKLNVFRMHPPRGGWGAKGIKMSYQEGGCLGLRRKGMDELLEKMY